MDGKKDVQPAQTIETMTGQEACDAHEGKSDEAIEDGPHDELTAGPSAATPFPGETLDRMIAIIEEALSMGSGKYVFLARHIGDVVSGALEIGLWVKTLFASGGDNVVPFGASYVDSNNRFLRLLEVQAKWECSPAATTAPQMGAGLWLKLVIWLLGLALEASKVDPSSL